MRAAFRKFSGCAITYKNNNIYYAEGKELIVLINSFLIFFALFIMIAIQSNNCHYTQN